MINDSVLTNTIIVVTTLWELHRTITTILRFFFHKKKTLGVMQLNWLLYSHEYKQFTVKRMLPLKICWPSFRGL